MLASKVEGRSDKQCRERWNRAICPNISRDKFSDTENKAIMDLYKNIGNKWVQISLNLPGRTG